MSRKISEFIRSLYNTNDFIPLHAPTFGEKEKDNVLQTIESTFVSSVGTFVDEFEAEIQSYTGATRAIATVNGTAALHTCLHMAGVRNGDLVLTQALTFVATCNAISHLGAEPIFIDISRETLSLCPVALESFLERETFVEGDQCIHRSSGRVIQAVVPMHTFGHPAHLDELEIVSKKFKLVLIEDAAESLGSYYKGKHTGTIGRFAALSFNGNKIITTGGGGMVLCMNETDGQETKHITTTAKVAHPYEFFHDMAGFNYRMPNLNAALGCAQMTRISSFLASKRIIAKEYREFFKESDYIFIDEPENCSSNFWLNAILCEDLLVRNEFLKEQNKSGIMCRPVWQLMHRLPMYRNCVRDSLSVSEDIADRLVNLPSSPV